MQFSKYSGQYDKRLTTKIDRALEEVTTEVDLAIATNEIYQICAYDKNLHKRLHRTIEANAFNVLSDQLHYGLLLNLFRVWDHDSASKTALPRILELLSRDDVLNAVLNRRYSWASDPKSRNLHTFGSNNPERLKLLREMWLASLPKSGESVANDAKIRIKRCQRMANHQSLERLRQSLRRFRNKAIAHMPNRRVSIWRPSGIRPLKNGDEKVILERTLRIIAELNLAVRGLSINFVDTRAVWRRYARALWGRF